MAEVERRLKTSIGGGALAGQIILAVVGVAAFLWLFNILAVDDPYFPDAVTALAENLWIGILIAVLAIILIIEIILLFPPTTSRWITREIDHLIVGCSSCGTTFEIGENRIKGPANEVHFACPNCDRKGRLTSKRRLRTPLAHHWCSNCNNFYQVYKNRSECPRCHEVQHHALK